MGIKQEEARRRAASQDREKVARGVPSFFADGQRTFDGDTEWQGYWLDAAGARRDCGHTRHQSREAGEACAMRSWQQRPAVKK